MDETFNIEIPAARKPVGDGVRPRRDATCTAVAALNGRLRHGHGHRAVPAGAVVRERLLTELDQPTPAQLRLIVGPAGSGKTTLLRQLESAARNRADAVTVWYTANPAEVSPPTFVQRLATAFGSSIGTRSRRINQLDTLLTRIDSAGTEFIVFIDDAHRLSGRPSAAALTHLLDNAPHNTSFVVASRSELVPAMSRLSGSRTTTRLDYRDLRFRTWEVESLYRDVYGRPLPPAAAAELCAQVEGWPAALHMFHLDTRFWTEVDRLAATNNPLTTSALIKDYLATSVLGGLPPEVRHFMVEASALGLLSGSLCDATLECSDSAALLQKLTENQALTFYAGPTGTCYRFHLLLQQHLENTLAERLGPARTRRWYRHAALQLVDFGHWAEAYRAFARAEDWTETAEILHVFQSRKTGLAEAASVPRTLLENDPWIRLANARRQRGEGFFGKACEEYTRAEQGFLDPRMQWQCSVERAAIEPWLQAAAAAKGPSRYADPSVNSISAHLLDAARSHPARLLTRPVPSADPGWSLARGIAAALDGRPEESAAIFAQTSSARDSFISLVSQTYIAVIEATSMPPHGSVERFAALATEAAAAGWLWLARIARACSALICPERCADAQAILDECRLTGDEWGALLVSYPLCIGLVRAGRDPEPALREAIERAARLTARVCEVWFRLLLVDDLRSKGDAAADSELHYVQECITKTTLPRAESMAQEFVRAMRTRVGAAVPSPQPAVTSLLGDATDALPPVSIRCLGHYELIVAGRPVDLSVLRPQARIVLRLLSISAEQPVHEAKFIAALWPDTALKQARHRLQVAVSSIRKVLTPQLPLLSTELVARRGETYSLRLPAGSTVDVLQLDDTLRLLRARRGLASKQELADLSYRALTLYRGELLSDVGLVEWVLPERDRLRGEITNLAAGLAELEIDNGNPRAAIQICQQSLAYDELHDKLWNLLATAHRKTGNVAAALRANCTYRELLSAD